MLNKSQADRPFIQGVIYELKNIKPKQLKISKQLVDVVDVDQIYREKYQKNKYTKEDKTNNDLNKTTTYKEDILLAFQLQNELANVKSDENHKIVPINQEIKSLNVKNDNTQSTKIMNIIREIGEEQLLKLFARIDPKNPNITENIGGINITVNKRLGSGSFGVVYRIKFKKDNDLYTTAIKCIKETNENAQTIAKELKMAMLISQKIYNHEISDKNIMNVYSVIRNNGVDTDQKIHLIVSEYCNGGSLEDIINNHKGALDKPQIIDLWKQAANAVNELHKTKITHRDIKPANFFLKLTPQSIIVKLGDFGTNHDGNADMGMISKICTCYYAAPEFFAQQNYDNKVDIWSLGILFDQIVHGELFYNGSSQNEIFINIMTKAYYMREVIQDTIQQQMNELLLGMLSKNTILRYTSESVCSKLDNISQGVQQPNYENIILKLQEKQLKETSGHVFQQLQGSVTINNDIHKKQLALSIEVPQSKLFNSQLEYNLMTNTAKPNINNINITQEEEWKNDKNQVESSKINQNNILNNIYKQEVGNTKKCSQTILQEEQKYFTQRQNLDIQALKQPPITLSQTNQDSPQTIENSLKKQTVMENYHDYYYSKEGIINQIKIVKDYICALAFENHNKIIKEEEIKNKITTYCNTRKNTIMGNMFHDKLIKAYQNIQDLQDGELLFLAEFLCSKINEKTIKSKLTQEEYESTIKSKLTQEKYKLLPELIQTQYKLLAQKGQTFKCADNTELFGYLNSSIRNKKTLIHIYTALQMLDTRIQNMSQKKIIKNIN